MNAEKLKALGWLDSSGKPTRFEDLCALDQKCHRVRDDRGLVIGDVWHPTTRS
jgi:hypothetical protein